jgi:hypothetical protein
MLTSPDSNGNPFLFFFRKRKDWSGLLRQFAPTGSGAGISSKKTKIKFYLEYGNKFGVGYGYKAE